MTHNDRVKAARAALFVFWTLALVILGALVSLARADTLTFDLTPATKDAAGNPLTAQTAITSHRVQLGSCTAAGAFDAPVGVLKVVMPITSGFFTAPAGLYCLRAFPSNKFGEGKPYPVSVVGPVPGAGGTVTVTVTSP